MMTLDWPLIFYGNVKFVFWDLIWGEFMDFEKILMQEEINTIKSIYFALEVKIVLRPLTRSYHILTVANNRVCPMITLIFGLFTQDSDPIIRIFGNTPLYNANC